MRKTSLYASLWVFVFSACALGVGGDMGASTEPLTDGSETYPYLIEDLADFDTFADPNFAATYWAAGVHTKLMTDIDLAGRTYTTAVIAPDTQDSNWTFDGITYDGVFDGNGHLVSSLLINSPDLRDYLGLFGRINSTAIIKNMGVVQVSITGGLASDHIGGLCGYNDRGLIQYCFSSGTILGGESSWEVGGLCGNNYGEITHCYTTGIVGGANKAYRVGGLCGINSSDFRMISYCYSATDIVVGANSGQLGALVGTNWGILTNCLWDVEVSGFSDPTGRRGFTTAEMKTITPYSNNKWAGDRWRVEVGVDYPRLAWENTPGILIEDPVVPLAGSGTETDPWEIRSVADLHLITEGTYYWDKHYVLTSNIDFSGTGIASIGFGNGNAFEGVFDGNDFTIDSITIDEPNGSNIGLFGYIGLSGQVKNLKMDNINLIVSYRSGGLCSFNNGQINNCFISGSIAGFGEIGGLCWSNAGELTNCNVDIFITRSNCCGSSVGGLCASNSGLIEQCSSRGDIINIGEERADNWGGICARNDGGIINKSFSSVSISGAFLGSAGGLCGYNSGLIENSYANGTVTAGPDSSSVGGFCGGTKGGVISNCYSTGLVIGGPYTSVGGFAGSGVGYGDITDCFWDVETSGMPDPEEDLPDTDGIIGFPKNQMQTQSTFTDAGWDFVGETANGTNDIWRMCVDGVDTPRLWYESAPADFACPDGVGMEDLEQLSSCWLADIDLPTELDDDDDTTVGLSEMARLGQYWLQTGCGDCGGIDTDGYGRQRRCRRRRPDGYH
jgi:hypothetical protein